MNIKILCFLFCVLSTTPVWALENFITRDGHRLMNGSEEFRFIGIHAPEMHRIEDDVRGLCKADKRGWGQYFKWPTADEQENWVKSFTRTGHKAMRITVLSIAQEYDYACGRETHVLAPETAGGMPRLNEMAMIHYDRLIALADKYDLRLILPIVDHWEWWGGRIQLAAFYGEDKDALYDTKSQTYRAYQSIIQQLLTRTNRFTGRQYKDEKAIMAWETGNELKFTNKDFLYKTTAYIKSLDQNHLVIDGNYTKIEPFAVKDPNVDIISNHYYENSGTLNPENVLKDLKSVDGKKAYLVGEFGLQSVKKLQKIMDEIVYRDHKGAKTAGAFIWGARGRRHNGGFYWHNEPANTDVYSYHLPGFPEGDANEELAVIAMVRNAMAQVEGRKVASSLPAPEAPKLRTIFRADDIRWMGAPVGRSYRIERATNVKGPWKVIGDNISDGKNKFDPSYDRLFSDDDKLTAKTTYYYRVIAKNESGESGPSNIQSYTAR